MAGTKRAFMPDRRCPAMTSFESIGLAMIDPARPDDVKAMTVPALAHRLVLKPELWASRVSATQVVESLLAQVPVPGATGP